MTQGVRLNRDIPLSAILSALEHNDAMFWSIMFADVMGDLQQFGPVSDFERSVNKSNVGRLTSWDELKMMSQKFEQVISIDIHGFVSKEEIVRYDELKRYAACEITIEKIDSSYWEVFSKNEKYLKQIKKSFDDYEDLESADVVSK